VNNRYNALAWRLRESLAQINGIELLTIKDTALQLVFTKKKGKEQAGCYQHAITFNVTF
jgi:hypothetical protein